MNSYYNAIIKCFNNNSIDVTEVKVTKYVSEVKMLIRKGYFLSVKLMMHSIESSILVLLHVVYVIPLGMKLIHGMSYEFMMFRLFNLNLRKKFITAEKYSQVIFLIYINVFKE